MKSVVDLIALKSFEIDQKLMEQHRFNGQIGFKVIEPQCSVFPEYGKGYYYKLNQ